MIRTDLINYLIQKRNMGRYLEICSHDEKNNFLHIQCAHKVTTYPFSSDQFFEKNEENFDIIFIDGLHAEEQVLKDIGNACRSLATGGIMVIHDCMPPDAWHQREPEAFREGENWNGTVWKAVLRVFNQAKFKCILLDTDWGCGIIDTSQSQSPLRLDLPDELDYEIHYHLLLKYKTSVSAFLRQNVKVFYHLACMGSWQPIFEEQMLKLYENGFQGIELSVLGKNEDLHMVDSFCYNLGLKTSIVFHAQELTYFETPALLAVEDYARQNEGHVLYLHSKGVSNPGDMSKIKWRRLMMRELVDNWEYCIQQLSKYDVIGVNWRDMPPTSHFCGNFWYSSTRYLRNLADFRFYYDHPRYRVYNPVYDKRLGCEFWIGSGSIVPQVLSVYCRNVDFCNNNYWINK